MSLFFELQENVFQLPFYFLFFTILGCQKCGTSSLAAYLSFIEGFKMSSNKEVHAFRGDKTHRLLEKDPYGVGRIWMSKSLRWYQHKVFSQAPTIFIASLSSFTVVLVVI